MISFFYAELYCLWICFLLLQVNVSARGGKKFLGANWKCNLDSVEDVDCLVNDLNLMWRSIRAADSVELCVNPPYVYLDRVRKQLHPTIAVGSQNAFDARGPNRDNTGTCTMNMLRSVGCDWVLLGHSDRRNNLGETDQLIGDKVRAALEAGMSVTITVGETKFQRSTMRALATLRKQLSVLAKYVPTDAWDKVVLAYEPVWAIGDGATPCSPKEAQRICSSLRQWVCQHVSRNAADSCRVTYTGSVNEANAKDYAGLDDVDGFVVGRAGLDTKKLKKIIEALVR